jgi:CBS domain containing-hemolysin-like protein
VTPQLSLVLVVVLIAANGLFVAAEFALVASRRGIVEEAAAAGDRRARITLKELSNISFVLSAAQFGITATSLVVGFLAEDAIGGVIVSPLLELLGMSEQSRVALSLTLAFLLSTIVQMLFGELAPKNLAIARPEPTSYAVAGAMRAFGIVMGPIIRVFDGAAGWLSRTVFKVEVRDELLGGYSSEELARIISASRDGGSLSEFQGELLERAVDLGDRRAHEVMVPRPDVVFLDADATVEDLRASARHTGHSRFPVRAGGDDDVVGTVHIKDLLTVPAEERATTPLRDIVQPALVVPESERLRRLLGQMRVERRTFAVVIDEYGGTAGIITVEDVLEELVGDIEDEFDRRQGLVRRVGRGRFLVTGALRVDQAAGALGFELPEGEYETVAGFVIDRLGRIPDTGEQVEHDGWVLEVAEMAGVRVSRLLVTRATGADTDSDTTEVEA